LVVVDDEGEEQTLSKDEWQAAAQPVPKDK
jgi:hypothetical protein